MSCASSPSGWASCDAPGASHRERFGSREDNELLTALAALSWTVLSSCPFRF